MSRRREKVRQRDNRELALCTLGLRVLAITFATILLSSCVTFDRINRGVNGLLGENIDDVVDTLGYPTDRRDFEGRTLYVWGNAQDLTLYMPQTMQTTGNIYGANGSATYTSNTTYNVPTNLHFQCTLILDVDSKGTVQRAQWSGNRGGCARYAKLAPSSSSPSDFSTGRGLSDVGDAVAVEGHDLQTICASYYPADARRRCEHGTVLLMMKVQRDGRVMTAAVEHSSGNRQLDDAAIHCVEAEGLFMPGAVKDPDGSYWLRVPLTWASGGTH
jgi:TonB family protein